MKDEEDGKRPTKRTKGAKAVRPKVDKVDHTLMSSNVKESGDGPVVFAVTDLRAYVKPDLDEELGSPVGGAAECGAEVLCTCVPVETCACNTVSHHSGGSGCPSDCACQCTGTCVGLYWFP